MQYSRDLPTNQVESLVVELKSGIQLKELNKKYRKIIIDYYGNFCLPCKRIKPLFNKMSLSAPRDVCFCSIDTDDTNLEMMTQDVKSVPTFRFYVNGKVVNSIEGGDPKRLISSIEEFYIQ